jgi:D-ribose pyranase
VKKTANINCDISEVVAALGHMDMLTVADAGLPIPAGVRRIDVALCPGVPGFIQAVETIRGELCVQEIIVAEEMAEVSPAIAEALRSLFDDVPTRTVPHSEFKRLTSDSKAVVRTGEFTPYANVILVAGVVF